ncbi:MAG TPA: hypothetical protein VN034_02260, partial [Sphingopyxis sp.]|nr:hypothetical protein [Sphingopyxis sp.]
PGLGEDSGKTGEPALQSEPIPADQDDGDAAADQRAMDRARGLTAAQRAYGIDQGSSPQLPLGL